MSGERQTERCARDSDWCDGMLCHDPPHGIGMNPGCPNADPVGLKSTCDKRPGCGCSIECKDYLARVRGERQTETHQAERPRVSDITPAWMNYADHLEAELTRVRAERDRFAKDAEDWEANAQAAEARVAELEEQIGWTVQRCNAALGDGFQGNANSAVAAVCDRLGGVQNRIDRAVAERTADLQAAVDGAHAAMKNSEYVGGLSEREAWRTALIILGEVVTEHKGQDEFPVPTRTREASDGD